MLKNYTDHVALEHKQIDQIWCVQNVILFIFKSSKSSPELISATSPTIFCSKYNPLPFQYTACDIMQVHKEKVVNLH